MPALPELATFVLITSLRAAILLSVAGLISLLLKKGSARNRLLLWTAALVGCLVLPLMGPVIPKKMRTAIPLLSRPEVFAPAATVILTDPAIPARLPLRSTSPAFVEHQHLAASAPVQKPERFSQPNRQSYWLLALWCMGALAISLRIAVGHQRIRNLGRKTLDLDDADWRSDLEEASRLAGSRRSVALGLSSQIGSPMTWGFWKPRIALPESARHWSHERRRLVLLHELIHVRRSDWLIRLIAQLACAAYWFNPLVWMATRRLTVEQEVACDDEVLASGTRPSTYAGHLLAIARSQSARPFEPIAALQMARPSQMETRLMSILDATRRRNLPALWAPPLLFLVGLVPLLAAVEPWANNSSQEDKENRGLTEIIKELEILEADLEPHEREIERLEQQLQPYEGQLAAAERELQPFERNLQGIEKDLEPYESQASDMERALEPFEQRLAEAEAALGPFEDQLAEVEAQMKPFEVALEKIERELQPSRNNAESLERDLEPIQREAERAAERMEVLQRQLERLRYEASNEEQNGDIEKKEARARIEEEIGALRKELELSRSQREAAVAQVRAMHDQHRPQFEAMKDMHEQMRPLYEEMNRIRSEMEPAYRQMNEIHREMEPVYAPMAAARKAMEPAYQRMQEEHRQMQSHYEEMQNVYREMEPVHREMQEKHDLMRPVYENMEKLHRELDRAVQSELRNHLEAELASVPDASISFPHLTERIRPLIDIQIQNGRLRLRSSEGELSEVLRSELSESGIASEEEMHDAIDRAIRSISSIEIPN